MLHAATIATTGASGTNQPPAWFLLLAAMNP
jgi:hypothetical protein